MKQRLRLARTTLMSFLVIEIYPYMTLLIVSVSSQLHKPFYCHFPYLLKYFFYPSDICIAVQTCHTAVHPHVPTVSFIAVTRRQNKY